MKKLYSTILLVFLTIPSIHGKRFLKIEELIGSPFASKSKTYFWWSDTELSFFDGLTAKTLNIITKKEGLIGDGDYFQNFTKMSDVVNFSEDQRWIMIPHDCEEVYYKSYLCNNTIMDRTNRKQYRVANGSQTQMARFNLKTNNIVYAMKNDLYFLETPDSADPIRLTTTGRTGIIYNGVCDWIYEDEVYDKSRAFYFSTNGTYLVYLRLDDSYVKTTHIPEYGVPASPTEYHQYAKDKEIRYPKPGTPYPKASVHVINLLTKKEVIIEGLKAPVELKSKDNIVVQLTWADDENVVATWANRIQSIMITVMCDVTTLTCKKILTTKQPKGWLDQPTFYFKNSSFFAVIQPHVQRNNDTYPHLTVVSNGIKTALTSGNRHVDSIVNYDVNRSLIYYLATNLTHMESLHLYVIPEDGSKAEICLSCKICGTVDADFSTQFSYYTLTCKGPGLGAMYVYSHTGTFVMELVNSTDVQKSLDDIILPNIYNFHMPLADGVSKATVRLYIPPNLDTSAKYPFLLNTAAIPGQISNTDVYRAPDMLQYMSTTMGIVVAKCDVRGSARRGDEYKFAVYEKLGRLEVEDYIYLTKKLMKKYAYIDSKRVGVYGVGYGGFLASMILGRDKEGIFSCGAVFAPFTNLLYGDAFFFERLMNTPAANADGYNYSDVTQLYENFRNKRFLLVGSTGARDYLYQHTVALARSLQMNNVPFLLQSMIDEYVPDHGWMSKKSAIFWLHTTIEFYSVCFNVVPDANLTRIPLKTL